MHTRSSATAVHAARRRAPRGFACSLPASVRAWCYAMFRAGTMVQEVPNDVDHVIADRAHDLWQRNIREDLQRAKFASSAVGDGKDVII